MVKSLSEARVRLLQPRQFPEIRRAVKSRGDNNTAIRRNGDSVYREVRLGGEGGEFAARGHLPCLDRVCIPFWSSSPCAIIVLPSAEQLTLWTALEKPVCIGATFIVVRSRILTAPSSSPSATRRPSANSAATLILPEGNGCRGDFPHVFKSQTERVIGEDEKQPLAARSEANACLNAGLVGAA